MKRKNRLYPLFILVGFALLTNFPAVAMAEFYVIPTVGRSIPPSKVLELTCASMSAGGSASFFQVNKVGDTTGVFQVPEGKVAVVTTVQVFPQNPGAGTIYLTIRHQFEERYYWVLPNSEPTQLHFSPGMIIGGAFYSLSAANGASSAGAVRVKMYGYLTDDK